jgi:hypothetical protein
VKLLRRLACVTAGLAAAAALAAPAAAQDVFTREALRGFVELRAAGADGERSWTEGGFGKTAFSGDREGDARLKAQVSQAVIEWRPRFTFGLSAVVSGQYQVDGVHPRVDLDEAYLKLRSSPSSAGRLSARVGVFYPPVSLEHGGPGWSSTDLLSGSALNSWIGEEVKVGAVEASYERRLGDHELTATAAVFNWNDTSGTLLTFRGWALGETRAGIQTDFRLPPLSAFMRRKQAPITTPVLDLDNRAGWYGRLAWRPPAPLEIDAFHYDNRGNRTSVHAVQWSWETQFTNVGLSWRPDPRLHIRAQALSGRTWMGYATPQTWVDVSFRAAYLMGTWAFGEGETPTAASLRLDAFDTKDHTWVIADDNNEHGWSATAGLRRPLAAWADLFVEGQRIESWRPSRALIGESARQGQTVLQTAVRLKF